MLKALSLSICLLLAAVAFQIPASELNTKERGMRTMLGGEIDAVGREEANIKDRQRRDISGYLPTSRALHFMSLGNDTVAADYMWITAAAYLMRDFDTERTGAKLNLISRIYDTIFELDPKWVDAYIIAGSILASGDKNADRGIDILKRGTKNNPDSWQLPFYASMSSLMVPGNAEVAIRYMKLASMRMPQPNFLQTLVIKLSGEAGRLDEAIRHARRTAIMLGAGRIGLSAKNQLRELYSKVAEHRLGGAIKVFKQKKGRFPTNIAELRKSGLMSAFDLLWAEENVLFKEEHQKIAEAFDASDAAAQAKNLPNPYPTPWYATGFLNDRVQTGAFPPPEDKDGFGQPFLYNSKFGVVRSRKNAKRNVQLTLRGYNVALSVFKRHTGEYPEDTSKLLAFFQDWAKNKRNVPEDIQRLMTFENTREHPLSAWGERYIYDRAQGRVSATWPKKDKSEKQLNGGH